MKYSLPSKKSLSILFVLSLVVLNTCNIPERFSPKEIILSESEFTIAWDPPRDEQNIAGYRIYYRPFESDEWVYIHQVDNPETTEYTIHKGTLPYGLFVFAVTSFSEEGSESEKHTSLDKTAIPKTGWFVNWITSQ